MTKECFIKIKDKNNTTLLKGDMLIDKPLSMITNEEIIDSVISRFYSLPISATAIKVYGVSPSVGDMVFDREIPIDKPVTSGIKYDKAKPIVGDLLRVFSNTLMAIGDCMTYNAKNHPEPDDWKNLDNAQRRLTNAMIRHLLKYMSGKELDEDDNIPHLVHVAWNALAVCELYLERRNNG
jgi:hypothetical protein